MAYNFEPFKKQLSEVSDWLSKEFQGIRTGRATPAMLDNILVEVYGVKTQVPHMATVSAEDARTLQVVPWDKGVLKETEKAILAADIGVTVSTDSAGLRVHFPELSEERREQTVKLVRSKFEEARVSVRNEREEVWNDIQKQTKEGEMTDDDKFLFKDQLQEIVDKTNSELEDMTARKEKEVKG